MHDLTFLLELKDVAEYHFILWGFGFKWILKEKPTQLKYFGVILIHISFTQ